MSCSMYMYIIYCLYCRNCPLFWQCKLGLACSNLSWNWNVEEESWTVIFCDCWTLWLLDIVIARQFLYTFLLSLAQFIAYELIYRSTFSSTIRLFAVDESVYRSTFSSRVYVFFCCWQSVYRSTFSSRVLPYMSFCCWQSVYSSKHIFF